MTGHLKDAKLALLKARKVPVVLSKSIDLELDSVGMCEGILK